MSSAKASRRTSRDRRARSSNSRLARTDFERIQQVASRSGLTAAALSVLINLLPLWILVPLWADIALLVVVWTVLVFTGVGLLSLVTKWKRAHKLPPTPSYSGHDPGAAKLDLSRIEWSREARRYSRQRQHWVVAASLLSPIAVLSLSLEIIMMPSGIFADLLILFEILVIGLALATVYVHGPFSKAHETWIPARLRAELLRRELFLYRARVGPYLNCIDLRSRADERINELCGSFGSSSEDELIRLARLLDMEHSSHHNARITGRDRAAHGLVVPARPWSAELEDSVRRQSSWGKAGTHHAPPKAENTPLEPGFKQEYLTERLLAQKDNYFGIQKELHESMDICWETMSILTLWFALAVACLHFGLMAGLPGERQPHRENVEKWVEVSALTLPPLGAFFIALRAYFENHRLSRSYDDQFRQLERLEHRLNSLSPDTFEADLEMKRLVLETEMLLSHEVRRWWSIVGPEIPKGS